MLVVCHMYAHLALRACNGLRSWSGTAACNVNMLHAYAAPPGLTGCLGRPAACMRRLPSMSAIAHASASACGKPHD